ncbi:hypothetical protein JCGZ_07472 [Jatropha curcas]|uniref:MYB family protein n=1 Tax=Jatropha curcas TaxID=180498 RepID=A0A067KCF4_JATCU|nr:hypothetical protein JCGZ_07472 [Jatropha curcas]
MGRTPCCAKEGLNRGPWSSQEDNILINYIKAHGDGKWRDLPKNAGLKRCGKSCRLRWLNYLRPDIKRGNISVEEEELIIRLHSLLGNRWSLIAGRLPGRTDNEIKNYWNTKLGKRLDGKKKSRGGEKNRKVYGIGSQASQFYCGSAAHASTASAAPQPEHTDEHYTDDIRAQLADQQRHIAELRVHVMRLSGEPRAGNSSSDPAPATDRHVSTSQQQPLPAPDSNAVDDTLVIPPGATSHPTGTPPGDPTSGDPTSDPADEQQHRFDFGPF